MTRPHLMQLFGAYQDALPLLRIGIFDCGEFGIGVFLLFYSVRRLQVKGLERCLDERVADAMHGRMHNFHPWALIYVSANKQKQPAEWVLYMVGVYVLWRHFDWFVVVFLICEPPVMTVFLDGSEVFCVDVLIRIFQQGALQRSRRVPRLRPGLQVLLYRLGDSFVVRRHNLGSVVPVHLSEAVGKYFSVHSPSLKHSNIMDWHNV